MRLARYSANSRIDVKYRPDIDGLRAIAVMAVVLFHLDLGFKGGFVGVDVFFVISGFLITQLIVADLQEGRWSLARFWDRRLRRIWPASLVITSSALVAGWFLMLPRDYRALANDALATLAMLANIRFWLGSGYFAEASELRPLMHIWSLAVEEQFYVLYPVLLAGAWRFGQQLCFNILCATAGLSFIASVAVLPSAPSAAFFLLPFRSWELLLGAIIALAPSLTPRSAAVCDVLHVGGLALILFCCLTYSPATPFPAASALLPTVGAALAIVAGRARASRLTTLLGAKPIRSIGLMSYSLYLWHWPLVTFWRYVRGGVSTLDALILLSATLLLAALSRIWIEDPFRRMSPATGLRQTAVYVAVPTIFVAIAALAIRMSNGAPSRVADEIVDYLAPQSKGSLNTESWPSGKPVTYFGASQPGTRGTCVFFWGDSHGMALFDAIDHAARSRGIAGMCVLQSATLPLPQLPSDAKQNGVNIGPAVGEHDQSILEWIHERKPAHVVLCARWTAYVSSVDIPRECPRPWVGSDADSDDARLRIMRRRLTLIADACAGTGSTLWIFLEVPYQLRTPQRRAIDSLHKRRPIDHLGIDLVTHTQKGEQVRKAFVECAPTAKVVDLAFPFFGKDGISRVGDGATRWYDDHTHLSAAGVRAVLNETIESVFDTIALDCVHHHPNSATGGPENPSDGF